MLNVRNANLQFVETYYKFVNSKVGNGFLLKEIGFFMSVMRKEFMVGYNKHLYILKFVATVGNIYNFEQN